MNRSATDLSLQEQLLTFFELDQRVRAMRARLDAALRRKTLQQRKLAQLKQAAEELSTQLKTAQAHAATLENEANSIEQRINAQRDKMNSATSNKEYSALLVEVNTLKADKGKIDDAQLDSMAKAEALDAEMKGLTEKVESQQKLVDGAAKEVQEAQAEVGGKLEELTKERDAAGEPLSDDIRKMFDRLSDTYDGEVMAEISEQDRRRMEYTCGGCYTLLPVESVNALITKPEQIATCGTCQRILYVGSELRESLAASKS
ncbi:MAG: zinc ribbon domain-containing protein [Phycisphaeraceae bacterium]